MQLGLVRHKGKYLDVMPSERILMIPSYASSTVAARRDLFTPDEIRLLSAQCAVPGRAISARALHDLHRSRQAVGSGYAAFSW